MMVMPLVFFFSKMHINLMLSWCCRASVVLSKFLIRTHCDGHRAMALLVSSLLRVSCTSKRLPAELSGPCSVKNKKQKLFPQHLTEALFYFAKRLLSVTLSSLPTILTRLQPEARHCCRRSTLVLYTCAYLTAKRPAATDLLKRASRECT